MSAKFDQNGFWVDHWTYTLDLIENYLSIFPDKQSYVLWDAKPVPFYMSPAVLKPRSTRWVVKPNPAAPASKKRPHTLVKLIMLHAYYSLINIETNPSDPPRAGDYILRSYEAISAWGSSSFPQARLNAMNQIFQVRVGCKYSFPFTSRELIL